MAVECEKVNKASRVESRDACPLKRDHWYLDSAAVVKLRRRPAH